MKYTPEHWQFKIRPWINIRTYVPWIREDIPNSHSDRNDLPDFIMGVERRLANGDRQMWSCEQPVGSNMFLWTFNHPPRNPAEEQYCRGQF